MTRGLAAGIMSCLILSDFIRSLAHYAVGSPSMKQYPTTVTGTLSAGTLDDINYSFLAERKAFCEYALASAELQNFQSAGLTRYLLMDFMINLYNTMLFMDTLSVVHRAVCVVVGFSSVRNRIVSQN